MSKKDILNNIDRLILCCMGALSLTLIMAHASFSENVRGRIAVADIAFMVPAKRRGGKL